MNSANNLNYTWEIVKVFFYLGIVILLIYLLTHLLRNFRNFSRKQGSLIQVIERNFLTQNAQVAIIQVGDKYYLLGVTDGKITLLDTFSEINQAKEANLNLQSNYKFADILKTTFRKRDGGDE
ncbi:MAG: flagellar biosynthetic protein FliO [Halanaerobiales bacterium]|nr:flagellar biosynthetic protein FliO [Halanaerobiales bacterium]